MAHCGDQLMTHRACTGLPNAHRIDAAAAAVKEILKWFLHAAGRAQKVNKTARHV
jgi:hypothetical protein